MISEKLRPFAHLFGKTPDEKLAELAGLSMEEFHQAKAALLAESKAPEKPRSEPRGEADSTSEAGGRATVKSLEAELNALRANFLELRADNAVLKGDLRELQDSHRSLAAAHYALDTEVRALRSAPPSASPPSAPARPELTEAQLNSPVKVIRNAKVAGPGGKRMVIAYGDIYPAGDMAAFLLKNYPDHVKIYEVKG